MTRLVTWGVHGHAAKYLERFFAISSEKSADLKVAETLSRDDDVNLSGRQ